MKKVLITGAGGFIGSALVPVLIKKGHPVIQVFRKVPQDLKPSTEVVGIGDINSNTNWKPYLKDVDVIIHLAGRAHVLREKNSNPLEVFLEVNTRATLKLAQDAISSGVSRFIFISSIGTLGLTSGKIPCSEKSLRKPETPYGISKKLGEEGLEKIARENELELVIVRPPFVYGPGVKGNFLTMLKWIRKDFPLPLGGIKNKRSMVGLGNLIDLLQHLVEHPKAPGRIFHPSDGEDISTSELLRRLGHSMGLKTKLFPLPKGIAFLASRILGRRGQYFSLFGTLQVDTEPERILLNRREPESLEEGLKKTVDWFGGR